jgi:Tfp pilus assembly protein PilF
LDDQDDSPLPLEIPGLDEATESWYQLDGNEPKEAVQQAETVDEQSNSNKNQGGLPFGYNGDSNLNEPNLPFGIGSNAQGVPFEDAGMDRLPSVVAEQPLMINEVPISEPSITQNQPIVPVVATPVENVIKEKINPLFESTVEQQKPVELPVIESKEIASTPEITEAHMGAELWTINAEVPDMEQLYSVKEEVVEYVHESDEPVLYTTNSQSYFNPELDSESQHQVQDFNYPLESIPVDNQSQLILKLHPAKALGVDLSQHPELEGLLAEAFYAIGAEEWDDATESFQQLAASKPEDGSIFNNYGLSLLQKALAMAKSQNPETVAQSEIQFRSSILSLREAAKKQPNNSTILLNLSHALLASGRVDKALQIIRVHNSTSDSNEGKNLEAAVLAAQGQSAIAKQILETVSNQLKQSSNPPPSDDVINSNLAKLSQ